MTDQANLGRQVSAYIQAHPETTEPLLRLLCGLAVRQFSPEQLRMLAGECPDLDQMGYTLKSSLMLLAQERETTPFSLGSK